MMKRLFLKTAGTQLNYKGEVIKDFILQINFYFPFQLRLIFGLAFFFIMGLYDFKKNPRNPKRLKEYLFIASISIIASAFGILHDFVTFSISREYFTIAKRLGDGIKFFPDIVKLAISATYWVGIVVGVVFVILNNPKDSVPQLSYGKLYRKLGIILGAIITSSTVGFVISYVASPYFSIGGESFLKDPQAFEQVAFIHWGSYIGALIGLLISAYKIFQLRRKLA